MEIDLESLIYKEPKKLEPKKGDILIAAPLLDSPYFKRSVVLLLEEDSSKGQLGLTMNIPTPVTLQDLFPEWKDGKKVKIYSGGPVESDRLFMLHTLGDYFDGAIEISPGLYVGADLDQVMEYIHSEENLEGKIRFFLGYSGWEKDQLVGEIMNRSWVLTQPGDMKDALTGTGNSYWRREVEKLGSDYRSWLLIPQNPDEN
ncbi:MAG: YqgE/AlgH family protein [Muribaculaceae bacterium]|nr:YqgE/AlgH family protein [Muribaculaceae bacterium]